MEMSCVPRIITGTEDHVHLLFLENPRFALSDIVKQLKGNTSHWINDHDLTHAKFVWQKGYAAFSENAMSMPQVLEILKDQETYHKSRTFMQEMDELISTHMFEQGMGEVERGGKTD
jgi:putative transposase